jgi:DDE superfamily endonuclease
MQRLGGWHAEQLVFIDETAANERTLDRKFGWSPVGLPSREIRPARRSQRWSVLPAYTLDGYIAYDIVHGSYNTASFNQFIAEKVLPLCRPPHRRSILIMDNASIHRSQVHRGALFKYRLMIRLML